MQITKHWTRLKLRFDELRRRWAYKLHPETGENADNYQVVLADLRDVHDTIGKDIPEVKDATDWVLGKDWLRTTKNDSVRSLYPTYVKYRSLTHFRDVLVNEYKRKVK